MKSSSASFRCRIRSKKICEVTGADNKNFLQRLLTNDLELLADKEMQLSSWCNIKGRVSILIKVVKLEDKFMLLVDDFNLERLMREFVPTERKVIIIIILGFIRFLTTTTHRFLRRSLRRPA